MEILAPAGSPDSLVAAIAGGADAVYLGGKQFGARKFSSNFDDGELEGAIGYAHERNVKVYVTANTIVKDNEMMDAVSYVRFLKNIGADAVILQDLGLLNSIQKVEIEKHASTQMGIHSHEGLEWCSDNGISRAILSRELTMDEMKDVVKNSPIDTEVFVQGALCYSMSGGCLFSSMAGGRSGNRGECAQPCRKRYVSEEREGYLLNTRDLYCIDLMDRLKNIGITSVKIEGRMRAPVHSYLTSKLYSSARSNGNVAELNETKKLLETIFNRGYGTGYMEGVKNVVQSLYPDNRGLFLGAVEVRKGKFDPDGLGIGINDGLSLFNGEDKIGGFKFKESHIPFKIKDGMYEMFRTYDPRIDMVKNEIPGTPQFSGKTKRPPSAKSKEGTPRKPKKAEISVYASSVKTVDAVLEYADRIYYEMNSTIDEAREICNSKDVEFVIILPRFDPFDINVDGNVMVHNPGQLHHFDRENMFGSYHLNAINSFIPEVKQITLSTEMSRNEIRSMTELYPGRVEVMVFGRTELMFTRDPEMTSGTLKDEKGFEFPVYRDKERWSHILNSADLFLINHATELDRMGVDSLGIDLRRRPTQISKMVTKAFFDRDAYRKEKIKEMCGSITYGHFLKGLS